MNKTIRIIDVQPEIIDAMPVQSARGKAVGPAFGLRNSLLERIFRLAVAGFRRFAGTLKTQRSAKAMRLCETISLGEKRFLAIVQVDEERILIGGSASSVALLTRLPERAQFSTVLLEQLQEMHSA
jgi:hypothetical protein